MKNKKSNFFSNKIQLSNLFSTSNICCCISFNFSRYCMFSFSFFFTINIKIFSFDSFKFFPIEKGFFFGLSVEEKGQNKWWTLQLKSNLSSYFDCRLQLYYKHLIWIEKKPHFFVVNVDIPSFYFEWFTLKNIYKQQEQLKGSVQNFEILFFYHLAMTKSCFDSNY